MGVNVITRGDIACRESDDLAVFSHGLARNDRSGGDLVAYRDALIGAHALGGDGHASEKDRAGGDDVVIWMKADNDPRAARGNAFLRVILHLHVLQ